MHLVFHDTDLHLTFAPLTLTRPLSELRMGLFTNTERWSKMLKLEKEEHEIRYVTEKYLNAKFPDFEERKEDLHINSSIIPDEPLAKEVAQLKFGEELITNNNWIARKGVPSQNFTSITAKSKAIITIKERWDLFLLNGKVIENDFAFVTKNRKSQAISATNTIIGDASLIFLEKGAKVEASILNTSSGPIYLAKDAEIMEGSMVRGGLALMEAACLKMGSKIYGPTSIGPFCKVGGEVSNSIFQAYSNKGHDGFLGNSIIGEWCNLGADTNSSNLKNNYGLVKLHSYRSNKLEQTSQQFIGLMMGDHSKSGINTMFNTATVVGISANVFGEGFAPKHIPSFSWGSDNTTKYDFEKACEAANNMMGRRNLQLSAAEKSILKFIAEQ